VLFLASFWVDAKFGCGRQPETTHNNELAELVLMLNPAGPLADRVQAMIFGQSVEDFQQASG
jgi:hypothetical protein